MDLDGDGHLDLLSGSWPGELFLFRGGPGRTFAPPEMLKGKNGEYLNIGGGISPQLNGTVTITGNADFQETPAGTKVVYHGKTLDYPADKIAITGTASAVHAVDWDGDGDLDLLVGDIRGRVFLLVNQGTRTEYAFTKERALKAGGKALTVAGDAGPFTADWDGDGDLDLLVGAGDGSVTLFTNTGKAGAPELAAGAPLLPATQVVYDASAPKEPSRGVRSKVCVADWNGDGRLDLLVGDYTTQRPDLPEPTPEQKAEHDRWRAELKTKEARYHELIDQLHGDKPVRKKEDVEKLRQEFTGLSEAMRTLHAKLPKEYEDHGWVWLFLRRPAADGEAARR